MPLHIPVLRSLNQSYRVADRLSSVLWLALVLLTPNAPSLQENLPTALCCQRWVGSPQDQTVVTQIAPHNMFLYVHLAPRLFPSTAWCSPQSIPYIVLCCFPIPGGSLLPCCVVLPSSAWSSPWSLPSPWLPLCAAYSPPIVLHSCCMSGPFSLFVPVCVL